MNLYKYLTPKKVELMLQGKIFLTPPKYLNDPWEFFVQAERMPETSLRQRFENYDREVIASMSPLALPNWYLQLPKERRWEIFRDRVTSEDFQNQTPEFFREEMSKFYGVVSLTEDPLNRIMWAHYSGINKGIAVGFRAAKEEGYQGLVGRSTALGMSIRVSYSISNQTISLGMRDSLSVFSTKHPDWEYESEWRIVQPLATAEQWQEDDKTYYSLPCRPDYVTHVVFGLSTDESLKIRVKDWLKEGIGGSGEILLIEQAKIDPIDQRFYAE